MAKEQRKEQAPLTAREANKRTTAQAAALKLSRDLLEKTMPMVFALINAAVDAGEYSTILSVGADETSLSHRHLRPAYAQVADYKQAVALGFLLQRRLQALGYTVTAAETKSETLPLSVVIEWSSPVDMPGPMPPPAKG